MARPFDLITFDFDGVLLHNDFNSLFFNIARELGLQFPAEREPTVARWIHDYYGTGQSQRDLEEHGREAFWQVANRRILRALGADPEPEDFEALAAALTDRVRDTDVLFYHEYGVHDLLDGLRGAGYRIAMLTNRDENIHEFAAPWGLIEPFEQIATRETVGKPKPEPDVYHHLAGLFEVEGDRALHIGDNPYADVVGARAAGWGALLIDPDDLFSDWDVPRLPTLRDLPDWLRDRA